MAKSDCTALQTAPSAGARADEVAFKIPLPVANRLEGHYADCCVLLDAIEAILEDCLGTSDIALNKVEIFSKIVTARGLGNIASARLDTLREEWCAGVGHE
jgi:hypothetical protein